MYCIPNFQFCEWISTPAMCKWAGPVVNLLLEHVGHVQLCSRLTELLDSREEWHLIKRKSCKCQIKTFGFTCSKGNILLPSSFSLPQNHRVLHLCMLQCSFSSVLSYSVTPIAPAPLQINDSDSDGERQTEIYSKLTSPRQTDQISKCG